MSAEHRGMALAPRSRRHAASERPIGIAIAVLAAAVLAGVLGWAVGGALEGMASPASPPHPQAVATGPLRLTVDPTWQPVAPSPNLAGAGLANRRAFALSPGLPGRAWIARGRIDGPTLVPAGLRARLSGPLSAPRPATLAGRPAWSYAVAALRRGGLLELTVVPTTRGVVLVGCESTLAWWSLASGCARGIASIAGAMALEPDDELAFRRAAPAALARLDTRRAAAADALHRARKARGQAAAASRISAAHAGAIAALAPLATRSGASGALVRALVRGRRTYAQLASAARRRDLHRYRRARGRVARADAALTTALRRLR